MQKIATPRKKRFKYPEEINEYLTARETQEIYSKKIDIAFHRVCNCKPTHINCQTPKEWIKSQLGVWQFNYERRDIRDKTMHPATFPISLARKVIDLFSHSGELVLDPFVGSGTTF